MEKYTRQDKLRIRVLNIREEQEHFHQDIELVYIIEGQMDVFESENQNHLDSDDILVINANKKHRFQASEDILFVKLSISYELVSDMFKEEDILFWCNSTKEESGRFLELRKTMKQLLSHYLNNHGKIANFGHVALCYHIMDILSVNFLVRNYDKENMSEQDKYEHRILKINNYIRANYNQPISLKELAEKLYLSNGYLSRFFKRNYGMSFAEYLSNVRLFHAVDELLYTSASITRIANDNGFASVAVFNKAFKKIYGETPSSLRKKTKEVTSSEELSENAKEVEKRLEQYFCDHEMEREEPVGGFVEKEHSVTDFKKLNRVWNRMMNIGAADDLLRSEVREHMILLKQSLGFEYVRFWNIFSEELFIDINSSELNFSRLDAILDFLVQQGMKPHMDLGQKPKRIQKNVQSAWIYYDKVSEFKDIWHWDSVLEALMRHLVHRYGRDELDTWRMELWYDERLWDKEVAHETYFDRFDHTYRVVRRYSQKMEVGGCGFRSSEHVDVSRSFLMGWRNAKHLPDFISVIIYPYVKGEENSDTFSIRSTDTFYLQNAIGNMKSVLQEVGMECTKLYVTEWNLTVSDRNYINDTCFRGAYIVRNVLASCNDADEIACFSGSDRISEYYDSNALLHGGMGVIAKDSIFKPAGYALEFLNRLYPYCIGQEEHYLISTDGHDAYGIMFHNCKKLNCNYYLTREDEIEKENIWKYFEDRESLQIRLKLKQLPAGTYQMKIYRINDRSGSVLDIWRDMNFDKELSREDIRYLRRVCEPRLSIEKCSVEHDDFALSLLLSPNEISYVRIRKI